MTDDVEFMDRVQLKAEVRRLRSELQEVRRTTQSWLDQQGHNRCWYYPELFVKLAEKLGLKMTDEPSLPPRAEFEAGCKRYQIEEFGESQ